MLMGDHPHADQQLLHIGLGKPEVSIILTTFNQEAYIQDAVEGLLQQEGLIAEIILSDDCSQDQTFAAMQAAAAGYNGPHHLIIRRNKVNIGAQNHTADLVDLAAAPIIILANGDDISLSQRSKRIRDEMQATGADVISSNAYEIDAHGRINGLTHDNLTTRYITTHEMIAAIFVKGNEGSTLAWNKKIYQLLPRIDASYLPVGIDSLVPFRGSLLGGCRYINEPLLKERRHVQQNRYNIHNHDSLMKFHESVPAVLMFPLVCMLQDVQYLQRESPDLIDRDLVEIQNELEQRILSLCGEWVELRKALWNDGWRMDWIRREALIETSASHFQGIVAIRERSRATYRWLRWQLFKR